MVVLWLQNLVTLYAGKPNPNNKRISIAEKAGDILIVPQATLGKNINQSKRTINAPRV